MSKKIEMKGNSVSNFPLTKSPHFRLHYANTSKIRISNVDAYLTFSAFVDRPADDGTFELVREDQVSIAMNIQQVQKLNEALVQALDEYVTRFGPIPTPPVLKVDK